MRLALYPFALYPATSRQVVYESDRGAILVA